MALGVDPDPFHKFAEFVAGTKCKYVGRDIAGSPKEYVPLSALREYWTPCRISSVLRAFSDRLDIDVGIIRRQYLRIFSTLVYTHHDAVRSLAGLFISHNLSDERLPWCSRPSEWPDEPFFRDFFTRIAKHQWQFFPLHFHSDQLHDRRIHDEHILPIDWGERIAHGSAASICAFRIHREFNHLALQGEQHRSAQHTFVLKIFKKKYEASYENECRALQRLGVNPSPNLVKFYGSLRQLDSYCLILEYADGGDLGEFFENCPPPSTVEDVVVFWKSLFQVFSGLDRIHQLMAYNEDEIIRGIHQDIRPENILLMKGVSGSPYDFTPKVADFGLYSRVRTARAGAGGPSAGLDHYGNQRYSAPECSRHTTQRHKGINMITTAADIFSIGAVLSHTAAWVIGGREKQTAYFHLRKNYHETNQRRFKRSGYEGCFHDSIEPLPVVAQQHKELLNSRRLPDDATLIVLGCIEKYMLVQPPKARLGARDILEVFEQYMDRGWVAPPDTPPTDKALRSPQASSLPSTIHDVSPPASLPAGAGATSVCRPTQQILVSSHDSDATAQTTDLPPQPQPSASKLTSQPFLDAGSVSSASHAPQADSSQGSPSYADPSPISSTSPSLEIGVSRIRKFKSDIRRGKAADPETARLVDYLEHNLAGRDQFFFIDDSYSMHADKDIIADGFRALACIAKRLDPNQVELAFASRPRKVYKARRTKRLHQLVAECPYKGEGHLMENRLGELIDSVIIPHLPYRVLGVNVNPWARKKVSVYVFTDGAWGDATNSGDACGVERPVRRLIEELKKRRLDRTQVSLHFVRFGSNENGWQHLQRLDEFGRTDGWDIVDVKHITSGVAGMILGPLTRSNDDILTP